jgi:tRNA(Arg) A34 adenosine deaminase TadA
MDEAAACWTELDDAWKEAFQQAWQALRSGNIAVGACLTDPSGRIVGAARNRVMDASGPPGETWGSSVAHAEINALARVPFRQSEDLTLTTTLEPCLQCAGAIRLAPVTTVRFAGADRYWEGCHEFGRLSSREAARTPLRREGPMTNELGRFATLISLVGPSLTPGFERSLRSIGEGSTVDLAVRLNDERRVARLASMEVSAALGELWSDLAALIDG